MAIFREKSQKVIELEKRKGNQQPDPTERVVDISFVPNDKLVQLVVDAWTNNGIKDRLLDKIKCKALLAERGVFLKNPIVIDEDNYRTNMTIADDQVVLVLPDQDRVEFRPGQDLLETARLLMSITPNGI